MILIVIWAVCIAASVIIGKQKGRVALGWWMGILLGLIGVVIMLIVPKTHEQEVVDVRHQHQIEYEARLSRGFGRRRRLAVLSATVADVSEPESAKAGG
jgi:hypothetical protein